MANPVQVEILIEGVGVWNKWRKENPDIRPFLFEADLSSAELSSANLTGALLDGANLKGANLKGADLEGANLEGTNLEGANLKRANLKGANLKGANLRIAILIEADLMEADLSEANLERANLRGANLKGANLYLANMKVLDLSDVDLNNSLLFETFFIDVDLSEVKNLNKCNHWGPSTIDYRTLQKSGRLPLEFLRGVGLIDNFIDFYPSLFCNEAIQFYSCFISYSSKDQEIAQRLYDTLQGKRVRCWFAPEDLKIGDRLHETIESVIRTKDKLLLILSENSVNSAWVRKEVQNALTEEKRRGQTVLFPIRIDEAVMDTTEQWADDIRKDRHIGDFTKWKHHDSFQKAFDRLLRDLKVEK